MIQELTNNEIFSNEYRNIAPKAGDLAAVFEKNGRNLLMRLDAEGAMSLPEAVLFADYWFDPEDSEAEKKQRKREGVSSICFLSEQPAITALFTRMVPRRIFPLPEWYSCPFLLKANRFRKISISVRRLLFSFLPGTTETVTAAAAAVI